MSKLEMRAGPGCHREPLGAAIQGPRSGLPPLDCFATQRWLAMTAARIAATPNYMAAGPEVIRCCVLVCMRVLW